MKTELFIVAGVLGVLIVGGVFAYNRWQMRKLKKTAAQFESGHDDVLLHSATESDQQEERIDPVLGDITLDRSRGSLDFSDRPEPATDIAQPLPAVLDESIDYVASIEVADSIDAEYLRRARRGVLAGIKKPLHLEGYNRSFGVWEGIPESGHSEYQSVRIGMQLANRYGAVTLSELHTFKDAIAALASEVLGSASFADTDESARSAAELDKFCGEVDVQLPLQVRAKDATGFTLSTLHAVASDAGMVREADGRYYRRDAAAAVEFSLANLDERALPDPSSDETVAGVTFLLDFPRLENGLAAYDRMVDSARRLAQAVGGVIVDDKRRPMSDAALAMTRKELEKLAQKMQERHIPAGCDRALRLFS